MIQGFLKLRQHLQTFASSCTLSSIYVLITKKFGKYIALCVYKLACQTCGWEAVLCPYHPGITVLLLLLFFSISGKNVGRERIKVKVLHAYSFFREQSQPVHSTKLWQVATSNVMGVCLLVKRLVAMS